MWELKLYELRAVKYFQQVGQINCKIIKTFDKIKSFLFFFTRTSTAIDIGEKLIVPDTSIIEPIQLHQQAKSAKYKKHKHFPLRDFYVIVCVT